MRIMAALSSAAGSLDEGDAHGSHNKLLRIRHSSLHAAARRNLMSRQEGSDTVLVPVVQTALDVIVESAARVLGTVTLDSLPSNPTTVSLPLFGAVTIAGIGASPTPASSPTSGMASSTRSLSSAGAPLSPSATASITSATHTSSSSSSSSPSSSISQTQSSQSLTVTSTSAVQTLLSTPFSVAGNRSSTAPLSSYAPVSQRSMFAILNNGTTSTSASSTVALTSADTTTFATSSPSAHASSSASLVATTSFATTSSAVSSSGAAPAATAAPGTPTSTNPSSTTTAAAAAGPTPATSTGQIVGGVVGSVAGVAVLVVLALILLRWYRQRALSTPRQLSGDDGESARPATARSAGPSTAPMTQRSSLTPFAAAGFAPFVKRFRPASGQTATTTGSTAPSEPGFQKLGGRKLESVLRSGGDGYSEPAAGAAAGPAAGTLADRTFFRDSEGQHGGAGPPSSSAAGTSMVVGPPSQSGARPPSAASQRSLEPFNEHTGQTAEMLRSSPDNPSSADVVLIRPGPARRPQTWARPPPRITTEPPPPHSTPRLPPDPPPPRRVPGAGLAVAAPSRPDPLGRSLSSQDGSRNSRFSEAL